MLTIKPASLTDAPHILALQKLAYQSEALIYNDWTLPPLTQTLDSLTDELAQSICLTVWSGDLLLGSIRARQKDDVCLIGRLIVHPNHQRHGLGTQLLCQIEQHFSDVTYYELFTGNLSQANIRLYENNGYVYSHVLKVSNDLSLVYLRKPNGKKEQ